MSPLRPTSALWLLSVALSASACGAAPDPGGNFDHPMMSMVLMADGALHRVLTGSTWDSAEIAGVLRDLADAGPRPR